LASAAKLAKDLNPCRQTDATPRALHTDLLGADARRFFFAPSQSNSQAIQDGGFRRRCNLPRNRVDARFDDKARALLGIVLADIHGPIS
jgi:hypothetical protein